MASDARRGLRAMSYDTVKLRCFTVRVSQFSSLRSAQRSRRNWLIWARATGA